MDFFKHRTRTNIDSENPTKGVEICMPRLPCLLERHSQLPEQGSHQHVHQVAQQVKVVNMHMHNRVSFNI